MPASVRAHLELLAQMSRWMEVEGLDVGALSPSAVKRFRDDRPRHGYVSKLSLTKLRPLLGYLDVLGVLPAVAPAPPTEVDRLMQEFCDYLTRGLVAGSVTLHARVARRFLEERPQPIAVP